MKCDICNEKDAVIHIQQIIGSEEHEMHLCSECAKEKGISATNNDIDFSLSQLLTGLIEGPIKQPQKNIKKECPFCGKSYGEFRKSKKAGCPECYAVFSEEVAKYLDRMDVLPKHKGKFPKKMEAYRNYLQVREAMEEELQAAIDKEQYEEAAVIRDKIRDMDSKEERSGFSYGNH
ncbi:MAG: UvrB/UvrC motif-containing protein [Spirochaetia bacterium]